MQEGDSIPCVFCESFERDGARERTILGCLLNFIALLFSCFFCLGKRERPDTSYNNRDIDASVVKQSISTKNERYK